MKDPQGLLYPTVKNVQYLVGQFAVPTDEERHDEKDESKDPKKDAAKPECNPLAIANRTGTEHQECGNKQTRYRAGYAVMNVAHQCQHNAAKEQKNKKGGGEIVVHLSSFQKGAFRAESL
jgi:hypothetical protein